MLLDYCLNINSLYITFEQILTKLTLLYFTLLLHTGFGHGHGGWGYAAPYGHPITHPGFTSIGFPGHASASFDVKNRIAQKRGKEKRQVVAPLGALGAVPAALPAAFPSAFAPLSLPATYHSPVLTPVARPVYTTLPSAGLPALPAALPVVPGCMFSYSGNHFFGRVS